MSDIQLKPHVISESDAISRITSALEEMDLDDLAQILSQITETDGPIVVVHDGNDDKTAEELGADDEIPVSAVYENGENIGDLAEDGTIYGDDGLEDEDEDNEEDDEENDGY